MDAPWEPQLLLDLQAHSLTPALSKPGRPSWLAPRPAGDHSRTPCAPARTPGAPAAATATPLLLLGSRLSLSPSQPRPPLLAGWGTPRGPPLPGDGPLTPGQPLAAATAPRSRRTHNLTKVADLQAPLLTDSPERRSPPGALSLPGTPRTWGRTDPTSRTVGPRRPGLKHPPPRGALLTGVPRRTPAGDLEI